jgi:hypothetical protein
MVEETRDQKERGEGDQGLIIPFEGTPLTH